jgi:hypothetical protein
MTSWKDVELAEPELAAVVRATFAIRKHATMATIRRDGAPRISGTEVEFADDGEIYLGIMAGARRAADLRRDGRVAVHCPTDDTPSADPGSWLGDGKITARAVEVADHRFRLDVQSVVLTKVGSSGLEITSWCPERGRTAVQRG